MKTKNIFIAFILVVAVVAAVLVVKNRRKTTSTANPLVTPSVQQQLENKFNGLVIPEDEESIELKDVSGGTGMGLATRSEILADLPALPTGKFYQGWLEKDLPAQAGVKPVLLGTLKMAKGGWILNYNSSAYPGYNKVIVAVGGKHILEGSF